MRLASAVVGLAVLALACGTGDGRARPAIASGGSGAAPPADPDAAFTVVAQYPHDPRAYTQGLFFAGGHLFEGTGRYGESSLRRVELSTGRVLQRVDLDPGLFGEGIAPFGERVYQLTWRAGRGLVYDREDLERVGEFDYEGEGWGLTSDGRHLIMSDGTATLRFLDPATFAVVRALEVRDANGPVPMLNELEYVEGAILANVWTRSVIVQISPETGAVTREHDLAGLVAREGAGDLDAVLNGIAYDPASGRLFVTGKLWSRVYEVELRRGPGPGVLEPGGS